MSNPDPVQTVLDRLEGVRKVPGGQYMARCPAHDDKHASLSIGQGADGRALIDCKAGCAVADVVKAVGLSMSDLFLEKTPVASSAPKRSASPAVSGGSVSLSPVKKNGRVFATPEDAFADIARRVKGEFVAAWSYPGDTFRVGRFALADGEKTFRPIHHNGSGWVMGDPPGKLPLYRGDDLPDTGPVIVCEGEKCVDAARSVGLAAVTSSHGAGSAHKSDWRRLAGREVIFLPDNDAPGQQYAQEVAEILVRLEPPATVKIVDLPGLGEHGDIADLISADGPMDSKDADEIKALVLSLAEDAQCGPRRLCRRQRPRQFNPIGPSLWIPCPSRCGRSSYRPPKPSGAIPPSSPCHCWRRLHRPSAIPGVSN